MGAAYRTHFVPVIEIAATGAVQGGWQARVGDARFVQKKRSQCVDDILALVVQGE